MYKMSVFWVSRFGPCCEINLEVESRAQEAAGRAQEPWQFHQLLSGVPWYIYSTPKFPFQVDQFSGRDCKYLAVANGITSGEKLQYMYNIQYSTAPSPHRMGFGLFCVMYDRMREFVPYLPLCPCSRPPATVCFVRHWHGGAKSDAKALFLCHTNYSYCNHHKVL